MRRPYAARVSLLTGVGIFVCRRIECTGDQLVTLGQVSERIGAQGRLLRKLNSYGQSDRSVVARTSCEWVWPFGGRTSCQAARLIRHAEIQWPYDLLLFRQYFCFNSSNRVEFLTRPSFGGNEQLRSQSAPLVSLLLGATICNRVYHVGPSRRICETA